MGREGEEGDGGDGDGKSLLHWRNICKYFPKKFSFHPDNFPEKKRNFKEEENCGLFFVKGLHGNAVT